MVGKTLCLVADVATVIQKGRRKSAISVAL